MQGCTLWGHHPAEQTCHCIASSFFPAEDGAHEEQQMGLYREKIAFASQLRQPRFTPFLHAPIFAKPFPRSGSREAAAPSPGGHLLCALVHWLAEPLHSMLIKLDPNTHLGKWDAGCPLLLWQPCEPGTGWVSCRLDELSWAGSADAAAGSWCSSKRGSVEGSEWKRSASLDAVQGIIII